MCCVLAVVASCAQSTKSASVAPRDQTMPSAGSPHDQIEQLDAQLQQSRALMQLTEPAMGAASTAPISSTADASCHPAPSDTCHDSCKLAYSICYNAAKICDLASQLATDTWANGKCDSAKATCSAAHAKCCGC
jgi:hypothetical protein